MSRVRFLFIIAILALISFLIQSISGFILWLVLPHGGQHGTGSKGLDENGIESTFIWARQTWVDIHDWAAIAFLIIISIHIYMHRQWLYRQAKTILKPR